MYDVIVVDITARQSLNYIERNFVAELYTSCKLLLAVLANSQIDKSRFLAQGSRVIMGLILGLCSANERRRYFVTTSLIGWAQA